MACDTGAVWRLHQAPPVLLPIQARVTAQAGIPPPASAPNRTSRLPSRFSLRSELTNQRLLRTIGLSLGNRPVPGESSEWQAFLERTIPKTEIADAGAAYAHLLKYGLSRNYCPATTAEVRPVPQLLCGGYRVPNRRLPEGTTMSGRMDAYVNHTPNMIMLAGIPDMPVSLPHSRSRTRRTQEP